jgi:hypothetical protein
MKSKNATRIIQPLTLAQETAGGGTHCGWNRER